MADAGSGIGTHREGRQQRSRQAKQTGASGRGGQRAGTKAKASESALRRRGKTRKHVSEDR